MTDPPTAFSSQESADLLALAEQIGRIGVIDWNVRSGTVRLSPTALTMYGLNEFDGRYDTWIATVYREDVVRLRETIATALEAREREFELDFRIVRPSDNALRWIHARRLPFYDEAGQPVRVVGVSIDVTDRKRELVELRKFTETLEAAVKERTRELEAQHEARKQAEAALRHAQKMEAVGQLTGGIAHDFNNMLAVVIGSLNLVERRLARGESAEKFIVSAMEGAKRAATLTNRLLAFSRQLPLNPEAIDANRMVGNMSEMLRRTLGEATPIETVLAGGLWRIYGDAGQIENSIVNLAINARDAMPEGGKLTIETANSYLDDEYAKTQEDVRAGQYVMIAVSDTGTGMPPDVIAKAFEPFFTTKGVGKGTGLGLSQVYGFVKQSHGHIRIYSEVGHGTTVKIYLPRHYAVTEVATAPERDPPTPTGTLADVILLVEDDDRMREVSAAGLRELGYDVLHASSGATALRILQAHPQITILFTDVVMPDMNGRKLADEALKLRPNLKILFTTGYTRNAVVHNGVLDAGVNFLNKPFTLDQLGKKIREVLSKE